MTLCASPKRAADAMDDRLNDASSDTSSLLSSLSRSPSPPLEFMPTTYPSPLPSHRSSQESSPSPDGTMGPVAAAHDEDGAPPAKKRRLYDSKPRTTDTLNLLADDADDQQKEQIDKLLKVLYKRRKIVVIAGAGISVSAGIPDFRSATGLFQSLKGQHKLKSSGKDLFDASVYKDDKSTTQFHDMVRNLAKMTQSAVPTPFHHLLATLAHEDRLLRLYSQNVDGIDTQLPPLATQVPLNQKAPWPKTIQLHGNLEKMVCSKCRNMSDLDPELFDGPVPPLCQHCVDTDDVRTKHAGKRSHGVGRLRPRMVLYNEHNPDDEAIGAVVKADLHKRPDALIVVGTSLKVPGVRRIVKEMCGVVRNRRGGVTIWINNDPPPLVKDFEWDLVVKGPCDEVANRACMRKWNEPEEVLPATEDQVQRVQESSDVAVVIQSPTKTRTFERVQGVVTPLPSPRLAALVLIQNQGSRNPPNPAAARAPKAKNRTTLTNKVSNAHKVPRAKAQAPTKKSAATKAAAGNRKINQAFTVSKSTTQTELPTAKKSREAGGHFMIPKTQASSYNVQGVAQQPMQPVSPSSARNNASPPFAPPIGRRAEDGDKLDVPKMRTLVLDATVEQKETAEERRRTISPKTFPKGMASLLTLSD